MATTPTAVKDEARRVIDSLPDDAAWEDVIYALYVRERVERGLQQIADGDLLDNEAVLAELETGE